MQTQNVKWIHRLLASLKLEPYLPNKAGKILLPYSIQPVIDMLLAASPVQDIFSNIAPSGTGWQTLFTIPEGERWIIHNAHAYRSLGSTEEFTAFRVGTHQMSSAAASSVILWLPYSPIPAPGGRDIQINISTHNAGDMVGCWLLVTKVPITDEAPY